MEFEWDAKKAARNKRVHGISFEFAVEVFLDVSRLEWFDGSQFYGEERWLTVGLADGVELLVAYTIRNETIRIISARKAESHEREEYWNR